MKKLIVGNWKMNPQSVKDAEILFKDIGRTTKDIKNADIAICPPFPYLSVLKRLKLKKINLGAQNVSPEQKGAFTGEVSASMLRDLGVRFVIVGHSERRAMGETDDIVNKKLLAVLRAKLSPILCVGEVTRTNDASYLDVVKSELRDCLSGVRSSDLKNIIIAYEPVWALSSTEHRHDATPHDFEEMKIFIRKVLTDMFTPGTAKNTRIIYGGSASKENAESFLSAGAEGLLPGKASLDARNFGDIISIASRIR